MKKFRKLTVGDPAPWFIQRSISNEKYVFDTIAGRYIVLCFFISAQQEAAKKAIDFAMTRPDFFNDERGSFFGISIDKSDETEKRVTDRYPGYRYIWDFDGHVSRQYGVLPLENGATETLPTLFPRWVVLDPTLRVMKHIAFRNDGGDLEELNACLDSLPAVDRFAGMQLQAPIIVLPNVFEHTLCDQLIEMYNTHGGTESGFMREIDGKTVGMFDSGYKRRRDHTIEDVELKNSIKNIFMRRVTPEISKVHQFAATRMERYIVACYDSADNAHFRAHRDNTTKGTAHRRFAVSINLNDEFEGGEVCFPEYGPRSFKAPKGGAVVFSCSLLHSVSRVTSGKRFAFLPFLYDEAAAKLREENRQYLGGTPETSVN